MAIEEKNTTFKVKWQATSSNMKSQEIDLEEGIKVCFGIKNNLFHHMVYLVSKTCQPSTLEISEVYFATCSAPEQRKQMKLIIAEGPTCVFSTDVVDWKSPLTLTCWISLKVKDSMGEFSHQLIDSNLSNHLWTTAKRGRYTDVEFRIGQPSKQKVFTAHRSILAARSSIFAGQFDKECQLNSIVIEDVHHSVFKQFLRFLYTGQLKVASVSNMSELLTLADRYQIAALQSLCRNPVQELNASELTSLIISLNNPSTPSRCESFSSKSTGFRSNQVSPTAAIDGLSPSHHVSFQHSVQHAQTRPSSNQDGPNPFNLSGPISTSSNLNYTFPKANLSNSGPMSFCYTPSCTCASPPNDPNSSSSTPVGRTRSLQTSVSTSTPAEGLIQFKPLSRNSASAPAGHNESIDSKVMSLKANVVANAVNQLRLIFDEMLGETSTSASSESSASSENSPQAGPPPTPASSSQKKAFSFLPARLNTSSGSPSLGPPSFSTFSFPSVTKEGRFGKVPLKSPSVGLPWRPDHVPDGQSNSAVGSPSTSCHTSLTNTSALDGVPSLSITPYKSITTESTENVSKLYDIADGTGTDSPKQAGSGSNSLCLEVVRNVNNSTTAISIL